MVEFRRDQIGEVEAGALTPAEIYPDPALWLRVFARTRPFLQWSVRPYKRAAVAESVTLYTAGRGAKTLIVGYTGRIGRLFLPIAAILQELDHKVFDLLLLTDRRELHFEGGISGYATTFVDLARQVEGFAKKGGYTKLITYGASMGALPALRAGSLLGADRAVGVGGRFAYHMSRIRQRSGQIEAFDLICDCHRAPAQRTYALFSQQNREDSENAARLAATWTDCQVIGMPWQEHNFVNRIREIRRLDGYHAQIFDLRNRPDATVLRGLLQ